jgi:hypothetical protein
MPSERRTHREESTRRSRCRTGLQALWERPHVAEIGLVEALAFHRAGGVRPPDRRVVTDLRELSSPNLRRRFGQFKSRGLDGNLAPGGGEAYRTVVALQLGSDIYVLHAFKKKSKKGVVTPKPDVDLIKQRYKEARALAKHGQA